MELHLLCHDESSNLVSIFNKENPTDQISTVVYTPARRTQKANYHITV